MTTTKIVIFSAVIAAVIGAGAGVVATVVFVKSGPTGSTGPVGSTGPAGPAAKLPASLTGDLKSMKTRLNKLEGRSTVSASSSSGSSSGTSSSSYDGGVYSVIDCPTDGGDCFEPQSGTTVPGAPSGWNADHTCQWVNNGVNASSKSLTVYTCGK